MIGKPALRPTLILVVLAAAVSLATSACQGRAELAIANGDDPERPVETGSPTAEEIGLDGVAHPGSPPETELDRPDANELSQDELFQCDPEAVSSSPARVRRLSPAQFSQRWKTSTKVPYATAQRFRYSSDDRDSRVDDGTADQLVSKALELGREANVKRVGWGRCLRRDILEDGIPDRTCLEEWGDSWLYDAWERPPSDEEIADFADFAADAIEMYGVERGLELTAARPYADPRFLFRYEVASGPLDEHDRQRLDSWTLAQTILMAISDRSLTEDRSSKGIDTSIADAVDGLREAAANDALGTPGDVEQHVRALLNAPLATGDYEEPILPTNIRRFFQEWLGYPQAQFVFKNGGDTPSGQRDYKYWSPKHFDSSSDATIARIYAQDEHFFEELLTTRDYFVTGGKAWPYNLAGPDNPSEDRDAEPGLTSFPDHERAGLFTHPGWLAAHSLNQHLDPHPVHRGKWVLENLLCGSVPELPVTVDAQLPEIPDRSVRYRLESVTDPKYDEENAYCDTCHRLMNPLGVPFESYSHYGRWRSEEMVGDGSFVEVDASVTLPEIGVPELDGVTVEDAVELMELFSESDHVEGCFVRHTFRYFAGRDETYQDACTLTAMRDAYRESDGSFREMLVALMTSDTFLYRHMPAEETDR